MTTLTKPRARTRSEKADAGIEQPAKAFTDPWKIVADPDLSLLEKHRALNSLGQDARQLAVAAAEGMSGGEQSRLRDVILAKRSLEPSADVAFAEVLRILNDRLRAVKETQTRLLISRAIDALNAAREVPNESAKEPADPPEVPEPGSQEEVEEEIEKEKMDPGA